MDNVIRTILVQDGNGDELTLYEYEGSGPYRTTMGLGGGRAPTRLALDTGEEARRVDEDNFVLVATGERLTRIE